MVLIPYRDWPLRGFPYVSATQVLDGTAPVYPLRGAIALLGTSAPGLHDLRATPVGERMTGTEVQANIVSGILDQRIKHHPRYLQGMELAILVLVAAIMTSVSPSAPPISMIA